MCTGSDGMWSDVLKTPALYYSVFVSLCAYFSYQDIVYGEIKRLYLYTAIIIALCIKGPVTAWESFGGAVLGILLFLLAYYISKKQLGLADIWFSGFTGAFLGIVKWYAAISIGCIVALIFFMCNKNKGKALPFIPFLSVGACATELTALLFSLNT